MTIKDIAQVCETSKTTVSNVINQNVSKVSPEMVLKVKQAIKDLEYVPSLSAKTLAGKGSKLIGVIIPQVDVTQKMIIDNPFYSEFLSGIEYYLRKSGFSLVISVLNQDNCFEDMMMKWSLDGAVVFGIDNDDMVKLLGKKKIPTLLIDSYITSSSYYRMNLKDEEASYAATKLLLEEGRDKVALVTGKVEKSTLLRKRMEGYKRALEESNIPFNEQYVYQGDITYDDGVIAAAQIMEQKDITGIVATADILAFGVVNHLQTAGKKIPEEYSIIGFDDTYYAKIMYPKLTTIGQEISKRGEQAGELILKIINKKEVEKETLSDFKILIRETTKNKKL